MDDLLSICERVVESALGAGADEAEAYASAGRRVHVALQKNDLHLAKSMRTEGLGVRVFVRSRAGFAFANSLARPAAREAVERALEIARAVPADEHNGLPHPVPLETLGGLFDPEAPEYGVEQAVEQALAMLRTARDADPRVTVDSGELGGEHGGKAIASSRGVRASERESSFYCVIMGMAKDGNTVSSFDYQFDGSRSAAGIDPIGAARRFAANVVGSLGAVRGESMTCPVVLSPKSAAEILSFPIAFAVRASSIQKGTSKFADRIGDRVASDLVTVVDDSTLADGMASTSFDREGLAPRVLPLIERGVLMNYLYDGYTARKDGVESNGHAGGGAASVPTVATTNVVWSAGDGSLERIVSGVDRGILVTRFSGNIDPVSGDFSGSVKGGRAIRAGRLAEPLSGTMIAGNAFEILPSITAVSSEREKLMTALVPHVLVEGVAVSSG
jgi:PmbA protein